MSLRNRTAIVTGASRGIGAAMALALAAEGCSVALAYTSSSSTALASSIATRIAAMGTGARAILVQSDLSSTTCTAEILTQVLAGFYPDTTTDNGNEATRSATPAGIACPKDKREIDILVLNAGIYKPSHSLAFSTATFEETFNVNVRASALLVQAIAPYMPSTPSSRIITISAYFATHGVAYQDIYAASKAALESLTRSWAATFGREKDGLTANSVAVGYIPTDMNKGMLPMEVIDTMTGRQAVGSRVGDGRDVAGVVVWLAGDGSRWVTGETIKCDGGYLLG